MPEMSTTDAIFIARQVMEKYREKLGPCYVTFLDLEVHSTVSRDKSAGERSENERFQSKLFDQGRVRGLQYNTHSTRPNRSNRCHCWGTPRVSSEPVPLSACDERRYRRTRGWLLKAILYADDIALLAESREELQNKLQKWQETLTDNDIC
uniref:Reverse transcriptase domain-containing protein n=1 Tax=Haemonchus placei TaxID=6290 RepID=A0A0N4WHC3_HAEPC